MQTSLKSALAAAPYDAVFFALKSYDTADALKTIQPFASEIPPILCLQNGVDNETAIAEVVGPENIIAGTVTTAIDKPALGKLVLERKRGVSLAAHHPLSQRLHAALQAAGLNPQLYADSRDMKWSKLLVNLITNATCAILDLTPAQVIDEPRLFAIEVRALREALAVMRTLDLRVVDLPGLPVRALGFAISRLPMSAARPLLARSVGRGRGGKMPSLHIDLHSGKGRSEVAWLNGAVVRWGQEAGVPTPVNQVLSETLAQLIEQKPSLHSPLDPTSLIARLPVA